MSRKFQEAIDSARQRREIEEAAALRDQKVRRTKDEQQKKDILADPRYLLLKEVSTDHDLRFALLALADMDRKREISPIRGELKIVVTDTVLEYPSSFGHSFGGKIKLRVDYAWDSNNQGDTFPKFHTLEIFWIDEDEVAPFDGNPIIAGTILYHQGLNLWLQGGYSPSIDAFVESVAKEIVRRE